MSNLKNLLTNVKLARKLGEKLAEYQIRAEHEKAIVLVNGIMDIERVYGTEMEYESNKELLDSITDALNAAVRTTQGVTLSALSKTGDDAGKIEELRKRAQQYDLETTRHKVHVKVNPGTQNITNITVEERDDLNEFCADLTKALNTALVKAKLQMIEKLQEVVDEMGA